MPITEPAVGCWDSVLLESLTEDAFIGNLQTRYARDHIYTSIGTYLVAINPFRPLSIYSPDQILSYATTNPFKLPPHIYGLTNGAYQWMLDQNEDQCVILTGESNTGKTETARLVVHFLTQVAEARRSITHATVSPSVTHIPHHSLFNRLSRPKSTGNVPAHLDISRKCDGRSLLKKQRSVDADKSIEKGSHEKSVEFDFTHHRSHENITTQSTTNKCCHKHPDRLSIPPSSTSRETLPRKCTKHHRTNIQPRDATTQFNSHDELPPTSGCCGSCGAHGGRSTARLAVERNRSPSAHDCPTAARNVSVSSTATQSSCPESPKDMIRTTGSTSHRHASTPPVQITKKILKNPIARSASVRDARSSASSISDVIGGGVATTGTAHHQPDQSELLRIRDRIAQADVFLEAIGNATTVRNFNSSRYGKYFDIEFDFKGDPISGHVTHYMLEKHRVSMKNQGERNFHIFYQILSGADIQFLKLLKLQRNAEKYELLNHGCATEDDKKNFAYTKKSLEILGFGSEEILSVFKILSVVIKIGNLIFVPTTNIDGTEGCHVTNEYELEEAAQLLHIDIDILLCCLTQTEHDWNPSADNLSADVSANSAERTKLILCRALYGRLFTWLVNRINAALKPPRGSRNRGRSVGILDFCGFENVSPLNYFEQLCINYSDERMHQHFVRTVMHHHAELYSSEGLEISRIACFDNVSICDLLDRPKFGLLTLLDEPHVTCQTALAARLQQCCSGHPNFVSVDAADTFQIRHFSGPVTYSMRDLISKNADLLPRNICSALFHSRLSIVQSLFPEGNPKRSISHRRTASLVATLRTQLRTLLQTITPRKANHIFCVAPNDRRLVASFDLVLVQHQVRILSLVPLVRLWRTGHCHSVNHHRFVMRYKLLNASTWPHPAQDYGSSIVEAVAQIIRGLPLPPAEFTIGIRRVFVRSPRTVYELEVFRRSRLNDLACLIQKTYRGYAKRKLFLSLRKSQVVISSAWRTWRECRFGIPFTGRRHLWGLYRVAREEYRASKYHQQVEWATTVIHRQYIQWKRRKFLRTLILRLPSNSNSPLCTEWLLAPHFLAETSQLLRQIFHRWRCYRYRRSFDQTARNRMREKVTASIIFRDRKVSYGRSVAHPFLGDYVRLRQNVQWKKICVESNDQYVVFADIINKIARSSGKFVPILLVLSTSSMLLLDQRTLQIKYRVPAAEIYRLSLSPYLDDIAVFHVKASEIGRKKGDFVFQTGHVIEIVTKLFLVIQNATAKPPEVHISSEFEANFGQQTVLLTFKCASNNTIAGQATSADPSGGSSSTGTDGHLTSAIKCTRKGNRMEIMV